MPVPALSTKGRPSEALSRRPHREAERSVGRVLTAVDELLGRPGSKARRLERQDVRRMLLEHALAKLVHRGVVRITPAKVIQQLPLVDRAARERPEIALIVRRELARYEREGRWLPFLEELLAKPVLPTDAEIRELIGQYRLKRGRSSRTGSGGRAPRARSRRRSRPPSPGARSRRRGR